MSKPTRLKELTYWMVPQHITKNYSDTPIPQKTDVLIIGSGYTGMVTALQLKKADVDVVVVDKNRIGAEASAKNGGMALVGLTVSLETVMKKCGREKMAEYYRESLESINCVERLVHEGSIDCHFRRTGGFNVAYKPKHFEYLMDEQAFYSKELNHETMLVTSSQMREEIDSDFYHGGLIEPASAGIHPAKYIAGLVQMADDAGVHLNGSVEAKEIERVRGQFVVHTNRGDIIADNIVVATNGYTTNLTPWQMKRVVPVESFMIATEELPESVVKKLIPNDRMIFDTKRFLYYFRLSPDGKRLLFGGRPKQYWKSINHKAGQIREGMLEVYPQLEKYAIEYAWCGKVCFTMDYFPIIGEQSGLYYAMGYCGHGLGMATYFGFRLAEMILGQGSNTVFAEKKSIPIPLYSGKPWFLPLAHNYFRILDKIS